MTSVHHHSILILLICSGSSVLGGNQPYTEESVNKFKDLLEKSKNLLVISGHGMTMETGGVTYRAADQKFRRRFVKDICTRETFDKNPEIAWQFYGYLQEVALWSDPHEGHKAVTRLQKRYLRAGKVFNVATHNDDDLHQRARTKNVIEMFGSRFRTKCVKCGFAKENRSTTTWDEIVAEKRITTGKNPKDALPHCPRCDGLMRPDTIWYDEKMNETIDKQIEELAQQADLYIEVGVTPTIFASKSYFPIIRKRKIPCAEFNAKTTPNSQDFTFVFTGPLAVTVEDITAYWNRSLIGELIIYD
ncbi:NAD-dependent protein deacylase sirtuin-5, mitochondrial-like [Planococcus citri]|uniref:NAD-dependent protein deacylase sirtuin-5, mitochondrial-like n=1 Tax=Planococcus citri TaxID=170843 RepID=UPI0031F87CA5